MKQTLVSKTYESHEITLEQLEQIGKYTRRKMKAEELFVFSLILCDNQIDRDGERFPKNSLDKLAPLFLGKTGIFDHSPTSLNQCSRIFHTQVITKKGDGHHALKAWAYMVRSEKTADLILDIDAGIKKEVSVGCAVAEVLCSICGQNQRSQPCSHIKGIKYNGSNCHHLLVEPTDAYEWSFVAVPAQRGAGVVKGYGESSDPSKASEKVFSSAGDLLLTKAEVQSLSRQITHLESLADAGTYYVTTLTKEIVAKASQVQPQMRGQLLEDICKSLSIAQLEELNSIYSSEKEKQPLFQLSPKQNLTQVNDYRI